MPTRRRHARVSSGAALFDAFASTIRLLRWLLLVLVAIYLCSGIVRVGPNEDALIYRLGVLQRDLHPPGLLFALPPPIDRIVRVPTRTQHEIFAIAWTGDEEQMAQALGAVMQAAPAPVASPPPVFPNTLMNNHSVIASANAIPAPADKGLHPYTNGFSLTGDANIVQARFTLRYRIVDPFAFVSAMQETSVANLIEHNALDAATREMCGMKIDDALGPGLESFRARVRAGTQARVDALKLGIEIVAFEVNAITPPVAAAAAFAEVTSAQVQARTSVEQARTYRAQTIPKAQSEAFRWHSQADASARQSITRASAEAASFAALSAEHRAAPALVESRIRAEELEVILPQLKAATVLPDNGKLDLYLPGQ